MRVRFQSLSVSGAVVCEPRWAQLSVVRFPFQNNAAIGLGLPLALAQTLLHHGRCLSTTGR